MHPTTQSGRFRYISAKNYVGVQHWHHNPRSLFCLLSCFFLGRECARPEPEREALRRRDEKLAHKEAQKNDADACDVAFSTSTETQCSWNPNTCQMRDGKCEIRPDISSIPFRYQSLERIHTHTHTKRTALFIRRHVSKLIRASITKARRFYRVLLRFFRPNWLNRQGERSRSELSLVSF